MGVFNRNKNKISSSIINEDELDVLMNQAEEDIEDISAESEYTVAFNIFKKAIENLGSRLNTTFVFTIKERKIIMLSVDKYKIYWMSDDPEYITIRNDKKFSKIDLDEKSLIYSINHLDII